MKTKTSLLFLLLFAQFQLCKAQQTPTSLAKVENHLKGELDYTNEALELVQMQQNGEDITLGKINTDGTVNFNLSEFNIQALYDSIPLQHYNFHSLFLMDSSCKDRDIFAKTPFDDVYSQKYDPIFIKKYGENIAILYPVTNEKMLTNNQYVSDSLAIGSTYFWFYMDRAIAYKDNCIKTSFNGTYDIEVTVSANIQFKKGWNFIEENLVAIQDYSKDDYHTTLPKKIQFTQSSPSSKKVKWFLKQTMDDEKIQSAKRLYDLVPITKEQIEKWLPKKAGDFKRTSYEIDKISDRNGMKSNVFLIFENSNQKMEIAVIDAAESPDELETVNFAFAMSEEKVDEGASYVSKYDEDAKQSQILSVFNDRIVLQALGENMTAEQLWEAIKALDVTTIAE